MSVSTIDRTAKLSYIQGQIAVSQLWANYHLCRVNSGQATRIGLETSAAKTHIRRMQELLDMQDDLLRGES